MLSGEVSHALNLTEAPTGLSGFAAWPGVQKVLTPCTMAQTGSGRFSISLSLSSPHINQNYPKMRDYVLFIFASHSHFHLL